MNIYEKLLDASKTDVYEMPLKSKSKGLCVGDKIVINTKLVHTTVEKRCVLQEELLHKKYTVGDIINTKNISNLKQENFTRSKTLEELVPVDKIVQALLNYCISLQDIAEYLEVTEEVFKGVIEHYKKKHGSYYSCNDYTLYFEPLSVMGSSTKEVVL